MNGGKAALLVINMTNDFLFKDYNRSVAFERGQKLIPNIRKLQEAFIANNLPVIYVTDRHLPEDFELVKWGQHSMKGTKGSEIADGLLKNGIVLFERRWKAWDLDKIDRDHDRLFDVEKGTYSGFTDNGGQPTALHGLLYTLGISAGDTLFMTGLYTNSGVKHTAADAWFRGYHPALVSDCTDSFDDPDGTLGMDHSRALNYTKYWYKADVLISSEVIDRIGSLHGRVEIARA